MKATGEFLKEIVNKNDITLSLTITFAIVGVLFIGAFGLYPYFNEPEFRITTEECRDVTISVDTLYFKYGDNGWKNSSVNIGDEVTCWIVEQKYITDDNFGDIKCDVRRSVEKCGDVEVEKIDNYGIPNQGYFYDVLKEDLSIELLARNCQCLKWEDGVIWEDGQENKDCNDRPRYCNYEYCEVYQCGEYKIEVKK